MYLIILTNIIFKAQLGKKLPESVCNQCSQTFIKITNFVRTCQRIQFTPTVIETEYGIMQPNSETEINILDCQIDDKNDIEVGLCTSEEGKS